MVNRKKFLIYLGTIIVQNKLKYHPYMYGSKVSSKGFENYNIIHLLSRTKLKYLLYSYSLHKPRMGHGGNAFPHS